MIHKVTIRNIKLVENANHQFKQDYKAFNMQRYLQIKMREIGKKLPSFTVLIWQNNVDGLEKNIRFKTNVGLW